MYGSDEFERFRTMTQERIQMTWPRPGPNAEGAAKPVVMLSTTGGKSMLAAMHGNLYRIGEDLVTAAVTDAYTEKIHTLSLAAVFKPARLNISAHTAVVEGMIQACIIGGTQLAGIHILEEPVGKFRSAWIVDALAAVLGFWDPALAGYSMQPGHKIYGWPSRGIGSAGIRLIQHVLGLLNPRAARPRLRQHYPKLGQTLGEALLQPIPMWIPRIEMERLRGVRFAGHVHVAGGGIGWSTKKIIPPGCKAVINRGL